MKSFILDSTEGSRLQAIVLCFHVTCLLTLFQRRFHQPCWRLVDKHTHVYMYYIEIHIYLYIHNIHTYCQCILSISSLFSPLALALPRNPHHITPQILCSFINIIYLSTKKLVLPICASTCGHSLWQNNLLVFEVPARVFSQRWDICTKHLLGIH